MPVWPEVDSWPTPSSAGERLEEWIFVVLQERIGRDDWAPQPPEDPLSLGLARVLIALKGRIKGTDWADSTVSRRGLRELGVVFQASRLAFFPSVQ